MNELETVEWDLLFLGASRWGQEFDLLPGKTNLRSADLLTCTHAVAYNHTIFDRLLAELPADLDGMTNWIGAKLAIDQYLAVAEARKLLTKPVLATQPPILQQEKNEDRPHYVI